jgi:hypothetical protein
VPKIRYIKKKFSEASLAKIVQARSIVDEYSEAGYKLTLRQLYYQFVSRDLLPNTERSYKNLGNLLRDARLAGFIDWEAIEDRTRELEENPHWSNPSSIIRTCASQFALDKWKGQDFRPEVWIEKQALAGVIQPACEELDVPFFSCRGYTSLSEMWEAAMRLKKLIGMDIEPIIFHLGDHDPSGVDMSRDIQDRMEMFLGRRIKFERLALNMDQVDEYDPPPNPTKLSDSRSGDYVSAFGHECWELDALNPENMVALVRDAVTGVRDEDLWDERVELEQRHRAQLGQVAHYWADVCEYVDDMV